MNMFVEDIVWLAEQNRFYIEVYELYLMETESGFFDIYYSFWRKKKKKIVLEIISLWKSVPFIIIIIQ